MSVSLTNGEKLQTVAMRAKPKYIGHLMRTLADRIGGMSAAVSAFQLAFPVVQDGAREFGRVFFAFL